MRPKDVKYVHETIDNEGFDYAFVNYSDYEDIKDEEFHKHRLEFLAARKKFVEFLGLDSESV